MPLETIPVLVVVSTYMETASKFVLFGTFQHVTHDHEFLKESKDLYLKI